MGADEENIPFDDRGGEVTWTVDGVDYPGSDGPIVDDDTSTWQHVTLDLTQTAMTGWPYVEHSVHPGDAIKTLYFYGVTGFALDNVSLVGTTSPSLISRWANGGSGDWNAAANWDNGVPDTNGEDAVLGAAISSMRTVYTDEDVTVRSIQFDNANTYVVAGGGTITIQSDDPVANPSKIEVLVGNHEFQAKVTLANDVEVNVATGASLTLNNVLNVGSHTLTNTGDEPVNIYNRLITADGATLAGEFLVGGLLCSGPGAAATLAVGDGEVTLASSAIFDVEVSLAVVGPIEADKSTQLTTDRIVLADGNSALQIGGTLAISSLGDRTDASYWASSPVIIDNPQAGPINDAAANPETAPMFDAVTPTPPALGEPALHLGQGLFLRGGTGVTYDRNDEFNITYAVELDVLVALGGDADGDGKVWLSDWAALRANFGNTGTEKTWTEGNFDPWADDKVWLSDWAELRANFGNSNYTITEGGATAVPEPGTIAMLIGALAGLGVFAWRRV